MNLAFEVISLHDVDTSLSNTVLVKTIYLFIYLPHTMNYKQNIKLVYATCIVIGQFSRPSSLFCNRVVLNFVNRPSYGYKLTWRCE